MSAQGQVKVEPIVRFDPNAPTVVDVPPESSAQTELSKRRTALSTHRTGLSEHRTRLSEHRTDLSEQRTQLSKNRSELSHKRTTLSMLRSHLSNERTHLSYLRTAIALIGFGITLNRFAIYLIESSAVRGGTSLHDAKWVGLGMVVLGAIVLLWSILRFHRTSVDIEQQRYHTDWRAVLTMTVLFFLMGLATTLWLFTR